MATPKNDGPGHPSTHPPTAATPAEFTLVRSKLVPDPGGALTPDGKVRHIEAVASSLTVADYHQWITDPAAPLAKQTANLRAKLGPGGTKTAAFNKDKPWLPHAVPAIHAPTETPLAGIDAKFHSGMYSYDIDKSGGDWSKLRKLLAAIPSCLLVATSSSGDGLYAFIAGTRATTASEYMARWWEARQHFPDSVDTSTADGSHNINRLRYVCHDPEAYLADFVTPLMLTATEPERQPKGKGKGDASQQGEWQPGSPEEARAALAYVRRPVSGNSDYSYFRNMIWAMKDAGITRPDAEAWAAGYTNASRVPEIWNQYDGRPGGITAGTFWDAAKTGGWRRPSAHGGSRPGAGRKPGPETQQKRANQDTTERVMELFAALPLYLQPRPTRHDEDRDRQRLGRYCPTAVVTVGDSPGGIPHVAAANGFLVRVDTARPSDAALAALRSQVLAAREAATEELREALAQEPADVITAALAMFTGSFSTPAQHIRTLAAGLGIAMPPGADALSWPNIHRRRNRPLLPQPRGAIDLRTGKHIDAPEVRSLNAVSPGFTAPEIAPGILAAESPTLDIVRRIANKHYGPEILRRLTCYLCYTSKDIDTLVASTSNWGKDLLVSWFGAAMGGECGSDLLVAKQAMSSHGQQFGFTKEPLTRNLLVGLNSIDRAGTLDESSLDTLTDELPVFGAKGVQPRKHLRIGQPLLLGADWPQVDTDGQGVRERLRWVVKIVDKDQLTSDDHELLLSPEATAWLLAELVRLAKELLSTGQDVYDLTVTELRQGRHANDAFLFYKERASEAVKLLRKSYTEDYDRRNSRFVASTELKALFEANEIEQPKGKAFAKLMTTCFPKAVAGKQEVRGWFHIRGTGVGGDLS